MTKSGFRQIGPLVIFFGKLGRGKWGPGKFTWCKLSNYSTFGKGKNDDGQMDRQTNRQNFLSKTRPLLWKGSSKSVLNLFLSISMAYNVISCREIAQNTQILKTMAKFAL